MHISLQHIYRRKTSDTNGNPIETNFSIVSGYNAINDGKSYRDIDVWDSFNPTKPTIKKSLQTEASKITIDNQTYDCERDGSLLLVKMPVDLNIEYTYDRQRIEYVKTPTQLLEDTL